MLIQAERLQAAFAQMLQAGTDPASAWIVAGEKERITKAERRRDSIPVPGPTWAELCAAAAEGGIPADRLAALAGV